jgi:hypothetical protein
MTTAMFVETLENLQKSTRRIPETRSDTVNKYVANLFELKTHFFPTITRSKSGYVLQAVLEVKNNVIGLSRCDKVTQFVLMTKSDTSMQTLFHSTLPSTGVLIGMSHNVRGIS